MLRRLLGYDPLFGGQVLSDGMDGAALSRKPSKQIPHFSLQGHAMVEDDFRSGELDDVSGSGLVEMRVDSRAHQAGHRHSIPSDGLHQIGHEASRSDDFQCSCLG